MNPLPGLIPYRLSFPYPVTLPCAGVVPMYRFLPLLLFALPAILHGAAPPPHVPEIPGFRTVETAITARIAKGGLLGGPTQPGYLGVQFDGTKGKAVVA